MFSRKSRKHVSAFIERAIHGTLISHISASRLCSFSLVDEKQGSTLKMDKDNSGLLMRHGVKVYELLFSIRLK